LTLGIDVAAPKKLTRRQSALIADLFASELDEQEVLNKLRISTRSATHLLRITSSHPVAWFFFGPKV
jgi:hypothetical protein